MPETMIELTCAWCGVTFLRTVGQENGVRKRALKARYCSIDHTAAANRAGRDDRFWSKVDRTGDCWIWTRSRDAKGYGRVGRTDGSRSYVLSAHRVSWQMAHGEIPAGMEIMHLCDNPPCVRPDHLKIGTHAENMADMVAKGRSSNATLKANRTQAALGTLMERIG